MDKNRSEYGWMSGLSAIFVNQVPFLAVLYIYLTYSLYLYKSFVSAEGNKVTYLLIKKYIILIKKYIEE